ncbi:MAG TPA: 50S ribosomal protein L28 [Chloroflexi bacterium]|nr:50S ribosomal protein L28 [Chloroflexota bacterium]
MPRVCEVCGKRTHFGRSITRRGRAKSKGGIGKKTTGISRRTFKPNIQRIRVLHQGSVRRMKVCAQCIRSGAIQKAP